MRPNGFWRGSWTGCRRIDEETESLDFRGSFLIQQLLQRKALKAASRIMLVKNKLFIVLWTEVNRISLVVQDVYKKNVTVEP